MDSARKRSLKGQTLEELKHSTITSTPPSLFVQDQRSSELSERLSCLGLQTNNEDLSSVSRLFITTPTPPTANFTVSVPTEIRHNSPQTPIGPFGTDWSGKTSLFDLSYPSMVREQEAARNPLAAAVANAHASIKAANSEEVKPTSISAFTMNVNNSQNVSSPQPVFGRTTQLGSAAQPFSRPPLFERPADSASQRQSGTAGRGSDGHNHLFISNKSGNRRPDPHKAQSNNNPLQSLHRPPVGSNPLSQMDPFSSKPSRGRDQIFGASHRPRQTRIIDSSDDDDDNDDVFEIPKPANFPTWQPKPFAHPTFSSSQSTNPYFQPKPTTTTFISKSNLVANTVADGGIWEDRYSASDPSIYLDSGKANEELKALFEGSVEDEEDEPKTRRKKKELESKTGDLADQMKSLDVKSSQKDSTEEVDDDEDDDDGTIEGLKVKLLPHQREGVEWMRTKECGKGKGKGMTKGGILADDMGLGKTIQSIALMLTNKPPSTVEVKSDSDIKYDKCTLIVAPLALIKQWEGELKDRVDSSHTFKVCVHHGPLRAKSYKDLRKYDIVITTYQTLSSEHASCSDKIRAGCFGINWYRIILDEAHSIKNRSAKVTKAASALEGKYRWCLTGTPMQNNLDELQSLIAFLRIGPLDKYDYWKSRIIQPINSGRGGLAIKRLQTALKGIMKRRTKDVLKQNGALKNGASNDFQKSNDAGFKIVKRTVEKVEAEFTREERSFYMRLETRIDDKLEKMKASNRNVNYANALVLLLRLRQACNHVKLLGFDLAGERDALGDGSQSPSKKGGDAMDDIMAMLGGLNVEMKECDICQAELSKEEVNDGALRCRDCEEDMYAQVNIWNSKSKKKKEIKAITKNDRKIKRKVIVDSDEEDEDENKSDIKYPKTIKLEASSDSEDQDDNEVSESDEESDFDSSEDSPAKVVASTKIRHLLSILRNDSHTHKYIVFSFFTSMLDLIEPFLRQHRIKFARYDGSMRNDAREASLHSLREDPTTRVLLCSLRAGSLGLNLTAASRVVVLEPFWNPFVEEQAIDRVHRLNQTQDVVVYKLTIKDTVEARILELQEKKRELARVTVEGGAGAGGKGVAKLSLAEMMKLFEHTTERDAMVDMLGMRDGKTLLDRERGESTEERGSDGGSVAGYDPRAEKEREKEKMRRKKEHEVYGRRW